MSFVKVWIHAVWTTKKRKPLLTQQNRQKIFLHIHENALRKGLFIDIVNGYSDHVHCLFRLKSDQTIMKCLQLLKGESSFWVNKNKILPHKLVWQKEYYAISVSESIVPRVRAYIARQEEHHKKVTWAEEFDEFSTKYGFQVFKDESE